jgi:hypothetical protein
MSFKKKLGGGGFFSGNSPQLHIMSIWHVFASLGFLKRTLLVWEIFCLFRNKSFWKVSFANMGK